MIRINERLINLTKALQLEKHFELSEFESSLKNQTISDRVNEGRTLYPLNYLGLKYTKFGDLLLEFEVHPKFNISKFSTGSTIELFNNEKESEKGVVSYLSLDKVSIQLEGVDIPNWIDKGKVGLNVLVDSKTYDMYLNRLKSISDTNIELNILELYSENPIIESQYQSYTNSLLNESQIQAVNSILYSEKLTTIIHGPPGTGKTTTLVNAIQELIKKNKKIIICAPTNAAVDNICSKLLMNKVDVCRIGNPLKIDSQLINHTLDGKVKNDTSFKLVDQLKKQESKLRKQAFKFKRNFGKEEFIERKRLKNELKSIRRDIRKLQKDIYQNIILKTEVICGTFVSVLSENLTKCEFDYIIIDEVAQAIEPAIWAVSYLANKLVLAGDNFQLPPFVQSNEALKLGLNKSILESAYQNKKTAKLLNIQYRMNSLIMEYSNSYFYKSLLEADFSVKNWVISKDIYKAIEFIDTAGCGFNEEIIDNSKALKNNGEVEIVCERVNQIDSGYYSIGIISPYRAQVQNLQVSHIDSKVDINTIDSFQGQERDVIIISLVRSNDEGNIGFLTDYRRMNVAMTRAKKKLIIIGDSATIGNDKFYADLFEYIEKEGSYRSAWEFM